jgi:hypothetical protein
MPIGNENSLGANMAVPTMNGPSRASESKTRDGKRRRGAGRKGRSFKFKLLLKLSASESLCLRAKDVSLPL